MEGLSWINISIIITIITCFFSCFLSLVWDTRWQRLANQVGWGKLGLPVSSVRSKQAIPIKSCLVYPFSIAVGLLFTPALNRLKVEVRTRRLTPLVRPRDTPHWLSGLR